MTYEIRLSRLAEKGLKKLDGQHRTRVLKAIYALADNPRPHGALRMTNMRSWRIRIGNYRVVYDIHDDKVVVLVLGVGHRSKIYR